jgi:hypothetical protein
MKAVADKLAAKGDAGAVTEFKAKANDFAKKVVANFKDYEFVRCDLPPDRR